eukprot:TRINITY_DN1408_c1_g1_i1.p1 TRINITY_DN1408_c1_g1~~TRINITY_DN1408_c1_g1_i1.p1  ORF type:complete len:246 (+),score=131.17 TRINITY_DN1408_c1_g1_i1:92-829(+)
MSSNSLNQVFVVSGGNKGIGFEICKQLATVPNSTIVLGARQLNSGQLAAQQINCLGLVGRVIAAQLDVTNDESVKQFAQFVRTNTTGITAIIANAGISPIHSQQKETKDCEIEEFKQVFDTNTLGAVRLYKEFINDLRFKNYGRIVLVSSNLAQLSKMGSGWVAYRVSKTGMNSLAKIWNAENLEYNILVNTMCPGYCKTDMTGGEDSQAPRTASQGADTAFWLATLPDSGPRGGYFSDRLPMDW